MEVTVNLYGRPQHKFYDVENVLGATKNYPYWVIWGSLDEDGNQKMTFLKDQDIESVTIFGPPDETSSSQNHLKVVPLNGGDD